MRIAITGGAAEGKSTVLEYAREAGLRVISADQVAHELWQEPVWRDRIAEVLELPSADLAAVRELVFQSTAARRALSGLLHPEILGRMLASDAEALEIPLLVEACAQKLFEQVWVVTCGPEEQLRRLSTRVRDERLARQIVASQLSSTVKMAFSDEIFRTNEPEPSVKSKVLGCLRSLGWHLR